MWSLWQKAKSYNQLPSKIFGEEDTLAAWMLDSAVTWFGITIENALQERVKTVVGTKDEYVPRYTLTRLLDDNFKLPRPLPEKKEQEANPWAALMAWAGKPGGMVKRYAYKKPEEKSD